MLSFVTVSYMYMEERRTEILSLINLALFCYNYIVERKNEWPFSDIIFLLLSCCVLLLYLFLAQSFMFLSNIEHTNDEKDRRPCTPYKLTPYIMYFSIIKLTPQISSPRNYTFFESLFGDFQPISSNGGRAMCSCTKIRVQIPYRLFMVMYRYQ